MNHKSIVETFAGGSSPDTKLHVEKVVHKAHEELSQLLRERAALTRRIGAVKQTIVGLTKLFGEGILNHDIKLMGRQTHRRGEGVTDSCRRVLMEAGGPISAREVRDLIQRTSPTVLAKHKDPLATVTTVLGRLEEYGEAHSVVSDQGRRAWQWSVESQSG
jgi:chorismate mutase